MVVSYFDIVSIAIPPNEAHPKLIIDPNAVLAFSISHQSFQPIAGRGPQIFKGSGGVKHGESLLGRFSQIGGWHPFALARVPEFLGAAI